MTKLLIYIATVVLLLAANIALPFSHYAAPNFLFLLILFLAFQKDNDDFLWVAFFSGLLLDTVSAPIFGSYLLGFLLIAMIVNYATRTLFSADPNPVYIGGIIIIANLILVSLLYLTNTIAYDFHNIATPLSPIYLRQKIWLDVILNLIFAVPIYFLVSWEEGIIQRREAQNKISNS